MDPSGQVVCGGAENPFFFGHVACGVLVATPPPVELQSLNHWTPKEVLGQSIIFWRGERQEAVLSHSF